MWDLVLLGLEEPPTQWWFCDDESKTPIEAHSAPAEVLIQSLAAELWSEPNLRTQKMRQEFLYDDVCIEHW
jgi:hypothetical protein